MAAQLTTWPGLATGRPSCGVGRGFAFHGTQILHLHTGDEADLRLTRPFVDRLDQVLAESGQIVVRPGDDWVTVRLDTDTAGSLLITLISLAIQAVEDPAAPAPPCTWERTRRSERSGRLRNEAAREASEEGERPIETERTRRSERSGRLRTEAAREASEEGRRPDDEDRPTETARAQNGEPTLAAGSEERSMPRPLRRLRPLRQR